MQLVGATKKFIRKPFIWKSLQHGLLASLLAIIAIEVLISSGAEMLPEINRLHQANARIILYSGILLLGLIIPWACTYFAVRKYLKLTTDELHY
jgi:cell division transport system permease protein